MLDSCLTDGVKTAGRFDEAPAGNGGGNVVEQHVSVDELPQEEQAVVTRLVDDAVAVLRGTNRQAKDRSVPKAALRRRALKLSLKARIAAGG